MITNHLGITGYEIAPSNRAKCHACHKKIAKGTPRLIFLMNWAKRIKDMANPGEMMRWTLPIKRSICSYCAEKVLEGEIEEQKNEIKRLRKIKRQFKSKMKNEKITELIKNNEIMEVLEDDDE